jgi:hypothetical protein
MLRLCRGGRRGVDAEHEGGQDGQADAFGGLGGVPDLVEVLPPVLVLRAELRQQAAIVARRER